MNDETDKATPRPWNFRDESGAGIQIYGSPNFIAECIEFDLKKNHPQPLFGFTRQPVAGGYPEKLPFIAYETWIQFTPKKWEEMQLANAALIVRAVNEHKTLFSIMEAARSAINLGQVVGGSKKSLQEKLAAFDAVRESSNPAASVI